jgi:tetratricopeptide (TPR) repeat protein
MRLELSAPRTLYVDRIEEIGRAFARHPVSIVDHVSGYGSEGEATLEQAASLFTAGRNEAALDACEQSIALEPSFAAYKLRGQILQGLGRADDARRAFEFALSLGSDDADERAFVQALLRSMGSEPARE